MAAAPRHPAVRVATRWSARLLLLVVATVAAASVAVVAVIPRLVDGQAMTVLSGSMTPEIPVGSIVLVRPIDPAALSVGDVATYQKEKGKAVYVTHRVVGIDSNGPQTTYTFKGDANRGPDVKPVVPGQIRGKVWFHVPYLGEVRDELKTGGLMTLAFLLIGGYAATQIVSGLREGRRSRKDDLKGEVGNAEAT